MDSDPSSHPTGSRHTEVTNNGGNVFANNDIKSGIQQLRVGDTVNNNQSFSYNFFGVEYPTNPPASNRIDDRQPDIHRDNVENPVKPCLPRPPPAPTKSMPIPPRRWNCQFEPLEVVNRTRRTELDTIDDYLHLYQPGTAIAIVGVWGSGKTAIVQAVLAKLFDNEDAHRFPQVAAHVEIASTPTPSPGSVGANQVLSVVLSQMGDLFCHPILSYPGYFDSNNQWTEKAWDTVVISWVKKMLLDAPTRPKVLYVITIDGLSLSHAAQSRDMMGRLKSISTASGGRIALVFALPASFTMSSMFEQTFEQVHRLDIGRLQDRAIDEYTLDLVSQFEAKQDSDKLEQLRTRCSAVRSNFRLASALSSPLLDGSTKFEDHRLELFNDKINHLLSPVPSSETAAGLDSGKRLMLSLFALADGPLEIDFIVAAVSSYDGQYSADILDQLESVWDLVDPGTVEMTDLDLRAHIRDIWSRSEAACQFGLTRESVYDTLIRTSIDWIRQALQPPPTGLTESEDAKNERLNKTRRLYWQKLFDRFKSGTPDKTRIPLYRFLQSKVCLIASQMDRCQHGATFGCLGGTDRSHFVFERFVTDEPPFTLGNMSAPITLELYRLLSRQLSPGSTPQDADFLLRLWPLKSDISSLLLPDDSKEESYKTVSLSVVGDTLAPTWKLTDNIAVQMHLQFMRHRRISRPGRTTRIYNTAWPDIKIVLRGRKLRWLKLNLSACADDDDLRCEPTPPDEPKLAHLPVEKVAVGSWLFDWFEHSASIDDSAAVTVLKNAEGAAMLRKTGMVASYNSAKHTLVFRRVQPTIEKVNTVKLDLPNMNDCGDFIASPDERVILASMRGVDEATSRLACCLIVYNGFTHFHRFLDGVSVKMFFATDSRSVFVHMMSWDGTTEWVDEWGGWEHVHIFSHLSSMPWDRASGTCIALNTAADSFVCWRPGPAGENTDQLELVRRQRQAECKQTGKPCYQKVVFSSDRLWVALMAYDSSGFCLEWIGGRGKSMPGWMRNKRTMTYQHNGSTAFLFSPRSTELAVKGRAGVMVLNLATGKSTVLTAQEDEWTGYWHVQFMLIADSGQILLFGWSTVWILGPGREGGRVPLVEIANFADGTASRCGNKLLVKHPTSSTALYGHGEWDISTPLPAERKLAWAIVWRMMKPNHAEDDDDGYANITSEFNLASFIFESASFIGHSYRYLVLVDHSRRYFMIDTHDSCHVRFRGRRAGGGDTAKMTEKTVNLGFCPDYARFSGDGNVVAVYSTTHLSIITISAAFSHCSWSSDEAEDEIREVGLSRSGRSGVVVFFRAVCLIEVVDGSDGETQIQLKASWKFTKETVITSWINTESSVWIATDQRAFLYDWKRRSTIAVLADRFLPVDLGSMAEMPRLVYQLVTALVGKHKHDDDSVSFDDKGVYPTSQSDVLPVFAPTQGSHSGCTGNVALDGDVPGMFNGECFSTPDSAFWIADSGELMRLEIEKADRLPDG